MTILFELAFRTHSYHLMCAERALKRSDLLSFDFHAKMCDAAARFLLV